jgi:hypothetical protein
LFGWLSSLLSHGGTPVHHPFKYDIPYNKPIILANPPLMETTLWAMNLYTHPRFSQYKDQHFGRAGIQQKSQQWLTQIHK